MKKNELTKKMKKVYLILGIRYEGATDNPNTSFFKFSPLWKWIPVKDFPNEYAAIPRSFSSEKEAEDFLSKQSHGQINWKHDYIILPIYTKTFMH